MTLKISGIFSTMVDNLILLNVTSVSQVAE